MYKYISIHHHQPSHLGAKESKKPPPKAKPPKGKKGKTEKGATAAGVPDPEEAEFKVLRFPLNAVASVDIFPEVTNLSGETQSKVVEDVVTNSPAVFGLAVNGTIHNGEQFLDTLCSETLTVKVYQWSSDAKLEKKAKDKAPKKPGKTAGKGAPGKENEEEVYIQ